MALMTIKILWQLYGQKSELIRDSQEVLASVPTEVQAKTRQTEQMGQ